MKNLFTRSAAATIALSAALIAPQVFATHSWGGYHWARTANPFTVQLGDNVSSAWDPYLATTSSDWSLSSVLDTVIKPGLGGRNCRPSAGRVEVCNAKYGKNGWLGIASVWVSGSHITQGTVKLNDTYFSTTKYNTPAWKNLVMCQEVGHAFGLDHQDEAFDNANLGTCMDYTDEPGTNQHPNRHDFQQLETIYDHLDASTTLASAEGPDGPGKGRGGHRWGRAVRFDTDGEPTVFVRELRGGGTIVRFVIWAR